MYTYNYAQPAEYHFSLDSIQLAEFVVAEIKSEDNLARLRVLDLCAGCGVIGFELSWYLTEIKEIHFVEVQDIYSNFFQKNLAQVERNDLKVQWHCLNYDELLQASWQESYDLIVSNPPYFPHGLGTASPSEFKNRCRFFIDSTFHHYILCLANTLTKGGRAYFLLRPLQQHAMDLLKIAESILPSNLLSIKQVGLLRGTQVILLQKAW